jgi:redox-sensitive bicupin YhaK (pirin superfamily)
VTGYESIAVLRAGDRFVSERDGVTTRHLLSFGDHYDPSRTSYGPLIAHNDETLAPGAGYALHRHSGVEIVTWVVSGRLVHTDDAGIETALTAGTVQALSTGCGMGHAERSIDEPTRFVQMWLSGGDVDARPHYRAAHVNDVDLRSRLVPIAGGPTTAAQSDLPLPLRSSDARCLAGRVGAGERRRLPAAQLVHVFVVAGSVALADVRLDAGDSALVYECADATLAGVASEAEALVWALGDGR